MHFSRYCDRCYATGWTICCSARINNPVCDISTVSHAGVAHRTVSDAGSERSWYRTWHIVHCVAAYWSTNNCAFVLFCVGTVVVSQYRERRCTNECDETRSLQGNYLLLNRHRPAP